MGNPKMKKAPTFKEKVLARVQAGKKAPRTLSLNIEVWQRFALECEAIGTAPSAVIDALMLAFLNDEWEG